MNNNNYDSVLVLEKNYSDFKEYIDETKSMIYKTIIDLYGKLKNSKKRKIKLLVKSTVRDVDFDTDFEISKNYSKNLLNEILNYFVEHEDYEICIKIRELLKN
jgi:hypothetical protein